MKKYIGYEYIEFFTWEDIKKVIEDIKANEILKDVIKEDIKNFEKMYETLKFVSKNEEDTVGKYLPSRIQVDEDLIIHIVWGNIYGNGFMECVLSDGKFEFKFNTYKDFDKNGYCEYNRLDNRNVWDWLIGVFNGKI